MKLFLDTANVEEIRAAAEWGVIDGVTTNPSLIVKEGRDLNTVLQEIAEIVPGPVNGEVIATDWEGMVQEGRALAKLFSSLVVKIPMTPEGLKAVKQLSAEGIETNVTLVFSANQALLAAKAGARYVSPFVGRLDDIGYDGMALVQEIVQIYELHGFTTEVIAASIRHPLHVTQAVLAGAHIATIPYKVLQGMTKHPLTDKGLAAFLADWNKAK